MPGADLEKLGGSLGVLLARHGREHGYGEPLAGHDALECGVHLVERLGYALLAVTPYRLLLGFFVVPLYVMEVTAMSILVVSSCAFADPPPIPS